MLYLFFMWNLQLSQTQSEATHIL